MQKVTMEMQKVSEIQTHELFENLFPVEPDVLKKIEKDMIAGKYDSSQPIIVATWKGQKEPVCIDGHTRLQAAQKVGIEEVPFFFHEFNTQEEALEKAIKLQRNRRNMTDREIATCIETLDKKKPRGGDRRSGGAKSKASSDAIEKPAKSAEDTADLLGISTTKVERIRNVLNNGDPDTIEAVKKGEMSANQAYQKTRKNRKKAKTESKPTNAAEGQELLRDNEPKESPEIRPVFLSLEHFGALQELGGSVEEHVADAIDLYLKTHGTAVEAEQTERECPSVPAGKENPGQDANDDDEWFDPADYEEELAAGGVAGSFSS